MHLSRIRAGAAAALVLFAGCAVAQSIGEEVGTAVVSRNDVEHILGTLRSPLRLGDAVRFGGTIRTGRQGVNVDDMADRSVLSVAPNSEVVIDEFVYSEGGAVRSTVRLLKGVLRFATGAGRPEDTRIETPVSVLGPRGTVFVVTHDPAAGTTVIVEEGSVEFANRAGDSVAVAEGLASTVVDDAAAPTPPAPPESRGRSAVADVNSGMSVLGQTPLGNPAATTRLIALIATARAVAATTPPTSGASSFGGDGRY